MAFANSSYSDIIATTIESRRKKIANNVEKNNAVLAVMRKKGNIQPFSGGSLILEELNFAENGNAMWYSGYDTLAVGAQDVISAAQYSIKQLACAVSISGLESLQNAGEEQQIDLLAGRIKTAEQTLANKLAQGVYSDGTTFGGKSLTGLGAAVVSNPSTGTYGGIDRSVFSFWQNQYTGSLGALTASTVQPAMNGLWATLVRGKDKPDLILADNALWKVYVASLQGQQRFTDSGLADLGFDNIKFMSAPVVLDGGIGGYMPANVMYFLNTDYLFLRPHSKMDMKSLGGPDRRFAVNQDASVELIGWAGNMTCSGAQFQGYLQGS